jgi:SAM-dependent methyltransferase
VKGVPVQQLDVPRNLWRTLQPDEGAWEASAKAILGLLARSSGRDDLSTASVLDVGCGTKLTKAILEHDIPIGRYVGIDTFARVVEFLRANVDDPRFEFHLLNAYNARYNTEGQALDSFDALPVDGERFDVIGLFSVFTHLDPGDYVAMLELLRPCVVDDGRLIFSLFVDDGTVRGDFERELERRLRAGDPEVRRALEQRLAAVGGRDEAGAPDFVDVHDDLPLMRAQYSERYARQLIEGTGWEVLGLHPPEDPYIQHYFVCRPA